MMKTLSNARTIFAAAAFFALPMVAKANTEKANPVTGETETYAYQYVGSGTWTASDWENANGEHPTAAPGTDNSAIWDAMLINCTETISVGKLNGWTLQLGVFGGANVTVGELGFWTGNDSCFAAIDDASSLTISATTGNNWNNTVKFYVANSGGITFTSAFAPANPNGSGNINYYLKGSGSVTYSDSLGGGVGHVIKQADITLSGTSQIAYKPLVSFTSTTKTFTADATIKRLDSSDVDLNNNARLTAVKTGSTTLTTSDAVGTCELVQTSTGIDLYWVDGNPADVPAATPTVYKPSININFTSGTALSTSADVGIDDYAIPGTSWNNLVGNNGSLADVKSVDSKGTATTLAGASVTISGTRGYWTRNGLDAALDLRQGYIDDNDGNASPQFVVTGIPYYKYQLVLYFSNDTDRRPFGHLTVNGTNYKWDSTNNEIVTCTGTSADVWGSSDGTAYTEGGNYLVFPAIDNTDGTLTVIGHRWSGTQRAGLAAVQIIEVKPETTENDLIIDVSGDTTYTVSEAKTLSGTVYVVGSGTLTLNGTAKISAATIDVGPNVTMNVNADRLDGTTFVGGWYCRV